LFVELLGYYCTNPCYIDREEKRSTKSVMIVLVMLNKDKVSIYLSQKYNFTKNRTNVSWRPCDSLELNEARPP